MYCYTYVNQFPCIFNELQLWTHISSDHPVFLKTVASLSDINLPQTVIAILDSINKRFLNLHNEAAFMKNNVGNNPHTYYSQMNDVKMLIDDFINEDTHAISFYPQLMVYAADNKAWQELVKHIINEQAFMLELFNDLKHQLKS